MFSSLFLPAQYPALYRIDRKRMQFACRVLRRSNYSTSLYMYNCKADAYQGKH